MLEEDRTLELLEILSRLLGHAGAIHPKTSASLRELDGRCRADLDAAERNHAI